MAKYASEIISIGESIDEIIDEGMLIFFGPRATNGLEDYSLIINEPSEHVEICVGDTLCIGHLEYPVTAVGSKASETFSSLGHFAARFDGATEPVLPGTVHLAGVFPSFSAGDMVVLK